MKVWKGNENTDDKIIAVDTIIIYKCNPPNLEIDHYVSDFNNGIIPQKHVTGIPLNYIREIVQQEGKNYISLVMGKDVEEHLKISDDLLKQEIWNFFKSNIPNATLFTEQYSKLKAGKKPLIAAAVVLGLFLWTLPYAIGIDNGYEYEIPNGHYFSLTGIVLVIASFGLTKVITLFSVLLIIALTSFYFKIKNPPVIHKIRWR